MRPTAALGVFEKYVYFLSLPGRARSLVTIPTALPQLPPTPRPKISRSLTVTRRGGQNPPIALQYVLRLQSIRHSAPQNIRSLSDIPRHRISACYLQSKRNKKRVPKHFLCSSSKILPLYRRPCVWTCFWP